ncbi:hypothetical protein TWF281_009736 [Arthrobotrys megalospora]
MSCTLYCFVMCCSPFDTTEFLNLTWIFVSSFLLALAFMTLMSAIFAIMFVVWDFVERAIRMVKNLRTLPRRIEGLEARIARLAQSTLDASTVIDRLVVREREREMYGYGTMGGCGNTGGDWRAGSGVDINIFSDEDEEDFNDNNEEEATEGSDEQSEVESGDGDSDKENQDPHSTMVSVVYIDGDSIAIGRKPSDTSALIAQSIPKATISEASYLYTLDKTFRPKLLENSLLHGVPYRLFFTTKNNTVVVLVIPYKGCKEKPLDLASSPQFRWNDILNDPLTKLPTGRKLLAYYIQMTLGDVTAGWSHSTSWFSKKIGNAIRNAIHDPDDTVKTLTNLSLEGFKCHEMAMSLHQWFRVVEGYSKDETGELFLKDGWDRLNRRFEAIFQKYELLERQMTNAHTMISARINLQDAKSTNRLAGLGALFLPGAFMAAFFGMNLDSINDSPLPLWLFFATAIPATLVTILALFYGRNILDLIEGLFSFLGSWWRDAIPSRRHKPNASVPLNALGP